MWKNLHYKPITASVRRRCMNICAMCTQVHLLHIYTFWFNANGSIIIVVGPACKFMNWKIAGVDAPASAAFNQKVVVYRHTRSCLSYQCGNLFFRYALLCAGAAAPRDAIKCTTTSRHQTHFACCAPNEPLSGCSQHNYSIILIRLPTDSVLAANADCKEMEIK